MEATLKKIRWSTMAYGVMALLILLFVAVLVATYFAPRHLPLVQSFIARAPFPVAIVGYRDMISFAELSENTSSIKRFYENQDFAKLGVRIDFSTEDGQKRLRVREKEVLNKMLEDAVIKKLARERGIFVSAEMAKQGVARKLEEYGSGQEVQADLARLYGWKLADFEEKIVLPSLYSEKLNESFVKEFDPVSKATTKIEKAAEMLREGSTYSDVAKQYSEGQTALKGGDLGWFALADLAPELRSLVASQQVGTAGNVVESSLGFHIILVEEVKKEKSEQLYKIKQIFVRKQTFADWLEQEMKEAPVRVLDPFYQFDTETGRIEFRKEEWRQFEEELIKKASGDASFFF